MLTSFFSKSKPVNFLAVALIMAVFYISANFPELINTLDLGVWGTKMGVFVCFILSITVLDFIAKKNDLTKRSAFKIVIFAVFSVSFLAILQNNQVILANLCILLALRRIISLKSRKDIPKKIFDATFWICIASLFYFWAILFLFVVFIGILVHAANYFKNWLIPLVAFCTVVALVTSFHILVYSEFYTWEKWFQKVSFDFSLYQNLQLLIPLSIIIGLGIWTLFYYFGIMQKASVNSRPTYILVLFTLALAILVAIFSPIKDGSELIFLFVPLSLIISNYFEGKKEKIFKEILLIGLVLMPILILFIS